MEPCINARSKAAAWAWHQRGSGSAAAIATAQSEAAGQGALSTRLVRGGSPSRFKLEADLLLSNASIEDASDRLKSLHLPSNSSNSSSCGSDVAMSSTGMLAASPLNLIGSDMLVTTENSAIVMSSFSYGTASWDCGSTLFDSFELVAMSKTLDDAHQLNQGTIGKVCPHEEDSSAAGACGRLDTVTKGANIEEEEEGEAGKEETDNNGLPSHDGQLLFSINDSCGLDADTDANGGLYDCKHSRQAIYDMFCRYDNLTPPGGSGCDDEHLKKQSTPTMSPSARSGKQYRRRHLHSLSKALRHHFVQLTSQSRMRSSRSTPHQLSDESCLLQSASLPAKPSPHLHIHPPGSSPGRTDLIQAEGCGLQASIMPSLRKQYSSDDVHHINPHYHQHHHHHHHHHHHYLFQQHSDDSFGVLPVVTPLMGTDKSLLVAAAGLRASKVSSLQDYLLLSPKRRWGDQNNYGASVHSMEAHAYKSNQDVIPSS